MTLADSRTNPGFPLIDDTLARLMHSKLVLIVLSLLLAASHIR